MKILRLLPMVAASGLLILLLAGPGSRLAFWDFAFGFKLMRLALYLGAGCIVLGFVLALLPKVRKNHLRAMLLSIAMGAAVVTPILLQVQKARSLPYIHDLTTDTADPPAFVDVVPLRADAPNPVAYGGEEIAAQQRKGYPELGPLRVVQAPESVFEPAVASAQAMGWEMVATQAGEGRIEATDTTFWFGFKDDVVIRIRGDRAGSVIDVRSKSRVGGSDIGANAARIERYLEELSRRLEGG
ncbi:MAG: DUF1499 domain-containing protein [Pseudomonadota bacterium]